jgi:hypothetical protein
MIGNYTKLVGYVPGVSPGKNCTFDDNDQQLWCTDIPSVSFYDTSAYVPPAVQPAAWANVQTVQPTVQQIAAPSPTVQPTVQQIVPVVPQPRPVDVFQDNSLPAPIPPAKPIMVYVTNSGPQTVQPTVQQMPRSSQGGSPRPIGLLSSAVPASAITNTPAPPTTPPPPGNFFTNATIIGSIPNWMVLGGAGLLLYFLIGGKK